MLNSTLHIRSGQKALNALTIALNIKHTGTKTDRDYTRTHYKRKHLKTILKTRTYFKISLPCV